MQTIAGSYKSLSLLVNLNWDRLFYFATIMAALFGGAALGSLF